MSPYENNRIRSVFAPVVALQFSSTQLDDCRNFLATRSANTECVPVVDESQLLMNSAGQLAESGYRFNAIGFEALARVLSGGLGAIFNELSGEAYRGVVREDRPTNLAAAVGIYNTTMHVRFESLRERTLLVNHQEKSVDGFLGLDHRMLDNMVFFDIVQRELAEKQPQAVFLRAELIGRELRLFYIDPTTKRTDIHPNPKHSFAAGWYFANREESGYAVRGSSCLFTRLGVAIAPASQAAKLVHMGADLTGRTGVMVGNVASKTIDMEAVARQMQNLLSTSLDFSDNTVDFDAAIKHWSEYVTKFKIRRDLGKQIAKNAALVGSDLEPRDPIEVYTKAGLSGRNAYDLVCSILRQSRSEYATYRDLLQGLAMRMLLPEGTSTEKKR